jgi:hypothetical protein
MESIGNWFNSSWPALATSFVSALVGGAISRFIPTRKERTEERQIKTEKKIDARVFQVLIDPKIPRDSKGMTGAGLPLTRPSEISRLLNFDQDTIQDSLRRLEMRRRVTSDQGYWFALRD